MDKFVLSFSCITESGIRDGILNLIMETKAKDKESKVYDSSVPYTMKGQNREGIVKISGRKPTESTIVISDL